MKFKTSLPKARYDVVFQQGVEAAESGYECVSPYQKCRAEEAWLAGFDSVVMCHLVDNQELQESLPLLQLRDRIVDAFAHVQGTSRLRGLLPADPETIRHNVSDHAQSMCKALGDDWENPSCSSLIRLIARLVRKAHQWEADRFVLDDCTTQLGKEMDAVLLEEGSKHP